MRAMQRLKQKKGLSFAEVLVALLIVTLAVSMLATASASASNTLLKSDKIHAGYEETMKGYFEDSSSSEEDSSISIQAKRSDRGDDVDFSISGQIKTTTIETEEGKEYSVYAFSKEGAENP